MKKLSGKDMNMEQIKNRWLYLLVLFFGVAGFQASAQNLDEYLQIAAENNPELRSAYAQFEAALQRTPQVAGLPDPTLTVSAFGRMIETRLGAQEARFTLMQMFPWFGTLKIKEDASNLRAEAKFQEYIDIRNRVLYEVKEVYAGLYELRENIGLQEENLKILDSYRELALSGFRSGKSRMVDVVKVDIERDAALTEIELLKHHWGNMTTIFNMKLNRKPEATVQVEDTLVVIEPVISGELLFEEHPSVMRFEKQKRSYEAEEEVAKKEGLPMLGLGIDYNIISKRTDAKPEMNGQDAIMPMLSVSLPIYRKKYKAARREAEYMAAAMDQEQQMQKNELRSDYEISLHEIRTAQKLIDLYDRQIESSGQAKNLLISAFGNDTGEFEEVLGMNQEILMLKTQKIEAIKTGFIAEAKLEYLFSKNE